MQVVGAGDLPEYPIAPGERLQSHYYLEFHYHRWLTSDTRLLADLDVRSVYLDLIFVSQDQSPVGTLPCDMRILAKLVGVPQEVFDGLCKREIGPLHKWTPCMSQGVRRLHHPVVTELALRAVDSRARNAIANENDRQRKRLNTIRKNLCELPGGKRVAESQRMVEQVSAWIEEAYPGGSCTVLRVQAAWEALSMQ